jgi:glucokinase
MSDAYAVGVDLGGTKILAGVIDLEDGKVVGVAKKRTASSSNKEFLDRLYDAIDNALDAAKLPHGTKPQHLGIGIAGQVDREKGVLISAPNLGVTSSLPIVSLLHDRYHLPVSLGNDVEVATLGEQRFGAGKGYDNFLCIFVGTGIGGGIVSNGQIYKGTTGTAGEIGHITVVADGRLCGCGGRGHLEAYCSRTAITRTLLGEMHRGRETVLRDILPPESLPGASTASSIAIRSKQIAKAVDQKDELVLGVLNDAARYLGYGLASAINFFNPKRIVLGGGLIDAVDVFFEAAAKNAKWEALSVPAAKIEIVKAALGDYSGIVGAALLPQRED